VLKEQPRENKDSQRNPTRPRKKNTLKKGLKEKKQGNDPGGAQKRVPGTYTWDEGNLKKKGGVSNPDNKPGKRKCPHHLKLENLKKGNST